jgi:hypothetical protein
VPITPLKLKKNQIANPAKKKSLSGNPVLIDDGLLKPGPSKLRMR